MRRSSIRPTSLSWREAGPVLLVPGIRTTIRLDVADAAEAMTFSITGIPDGCVTLDAVVRHRHFFEVSLRVAHAQNVDSTATLCASATIHGKVHEGCVTLIITRFVLLNPLDPVTEVICASAIEALKFRRGLRRALAGSNVTVTTVGTPLLSRFDYWTRDAFASGRFVKPDVGRAALYGLRARSSMINARPLDQACARHLRRRGIAPLQIGQPRTNARWADWFGNIVMTPPLAVTPQGAFPYGRPIVGRQGELSLSDDVMEFLAAQGLQWPPVEIDTSWLYIGHADEVVTFVDTSQGFRALLASPAAGLELIDQLAASPAADRAMAGGLIGSRSTARRLSTDRDLRQENTTAAGAVDRIADQLIEECGLCANAIVKLPMLVCRGRSVWPNPVNGLAVGQRYLAPDPKGPRLADTDQLRTVIAEMLSAAGIEGYFVDTLFPLHVSGGEVHCATNVI